MDNNFIINRYTASVNSAYIYGNSAANSTEKTENAETDFKTLLKEKIESSSNLVFSKHALKRIDNRDISITQGLLNDVSNAVTRADEKGIKDALILGQGTAFIVNVPSRTVITTINSSDMNQNIITNIDGTVLL